MSLSAHVCLQHGITQTSNLVNIGDFYQTQVSADIQQQDGNVLVSQKTEGYVHV